MYKCLLTYLLNYQPTYLPTYLPTLPTLLPATFAHVSDIDTSTYIRMFARTSPCLPS